MEKVKFTTVVKLGSETTQIPRIRRLYFGNEREVKPSLFGLESSKLYQIGLIPCLPTFLPVRLTADINPLNPSFLALKNYPWVKYL
jgi:hypothetical protein